jgi:GT2 family glycosyltransferase
MDEVIPVTPKVAAILIAHNQATELRRALAALEGSQQREQLEILVVDCASEDDTAECTDQFPGVTVLRLPQHFGATKALNIATRTARAEFLFLLTPDVEVAPDTVARLAAHLEANADTLAVCPLLLDEQGKPAPHVQALPDRESLARFCATGEVRRPELDLTQESIAVAYAGREALLVRKQFVAGMNYFDERFGEYWADADLAMQIRRTGRKIRLYPGIRATWHAAQRPASTDVTHQSDRILGAAQLLSKHQGFFAGFGFRWTAILQALVHFDFALLSALMGGTKLGGEASRSYPT